MDGSIFRWINHLANRTSWAHGAFTAYAKYGIVLFAALLVAAYIDGRQHHDLHVIAGSVWSGVAAVIALEIGQIVGGAIDRARPYDTMAGSTCSSTKPPTSRSPATTPPPSAPSRSVYCSPTDDGDASPRYSPCSWPSLVFT